MKDLIQGYWFSRWDSNLLCPKYETGVLTTVFQNSYSCSMTLFQLHWLKALN